MWETKNLLGLFTCAKATAESSVFILMAYSTSSFRNNVVKNSFFSPSFLKLIGLMFNKNTQNVNTLFLFCENIFYKNIEAEICEVFSAKLFGFYSLKSPLLGFRFFRFGTLLTGKPRLAVKLKKV